MLPAAAGVNTVNGLIVVLDSDDPDASADVIAKPDEQGRLAVVAQLNPEAGEWETMDGVAAPTLDLGVKGLPATPAIADTNGDGRPDTAIAVSDGQIEIPALDSTGNPIDLPPPEGAVMAFTDNDGDGHADNLVVTYPNGAIVTCESSVAGLWQVGGVQPAPAPAAGSEGSG